MIADNYSSTLVGSSQGDNEKLLTYHLQTDHLKEVLRGNRFSVIYEHLMEVQEKDGTTCRDNVIIARKF